jgi:hypothetical protein
MNIKGYFGLFQRSGSFLFGNVAQYWCNYLVRYEVLSAAVVPEQAVKSVENRMIFRNKISHQQLTWRWSRNVHPKRPLSFKGIYDNISQSMGFLQLIISVEVSNTPAYLIKRNCAIWPYSKLYSLVSIGECISPVKVAGPNPGENIVLSFHLI